jgi:hypothetical protein
MEHELIEVFDPTASDYDDNSVDLSMIRWFMSLTPMQRLEYIEDQNSAIAAIREVPGSRLHSALRSMKEAGIDFILVGGLAAGLQGAPPVTPQIDLVFSMAPDNRARILPWLTRADCIFRNHPERCLRPDEEHLAMGKPIRLITQYGPIDLLPTIGKGLGYNELLPHTNTIELDDHYSFRVLNLETLISTKEQIGS